MRLIICIPTYNRCDQLEFLLREFVKPIISLYPNLVCCVVSDNSDYSCQVINKKNCANISGLTYSANENNLGYGGNIFKLASLASHLGEYMWFISDDDSINKQNFEKLLQHINILTEPIDIIALTHVIGLEKQGLPFETVNTVSFHEFLQLQKPLLPFILISSFILRADLITESSLHTLQNFKSDYAQISLCGISSSSDSRVLIFPLHLVEYKPSNEVRFALDSLFSSYAQCTNLYEACFSINSREYLKYWLRGLLFLSITERVRGATLANYPICIFKLLPNLGRSFSFRSFVLFFLALLPRFMLRKIMPLLSVFKDRNLKKSPALSQ